MLNSSLPARDGGIWGLAARMRKMLLTKSRGLCFFNTPALHSFCQ
jgi:hypothetical protein